METVEKMLIDFQTEKPVTIRCNTGRISPEALKEKLKSEGVHAEAHPYLPYAYCITGYDYLGELKSFQDGLFAVQDISSMLVGEIAAPKPGDYIIDVCAAPGGKALHLADKMEGSGHVEARDLTEYKVGMIQENIDRMQIHSVSAILMDASVPDGASAGKADIVIADLPCSGLGVLGRKTDLKYKTAKEHPEELAGLQRKILDTVCRYVKPGGTLVYSTCTIHPAENMGNVHWFLETHPEFQMDSIAKRLCEDLRSSILEEGCLQLLPGVNDSDGFFIARLIRCR